MGIKSAAQSLWESDGSGAVSIKGAPHQATFLTPNHSHYSPWIFHSNLNCFTSILRLWVKKNMHGALNHVSIFHTRMAFIEDWGYDTWLFACGAPQADEGEHHPKNKITGILFMLWWNITNCLYTKLNIQTEIRIKQGAAVWLFISAINWLWNSHVKCLCIINRVFLCK